MKEVPEQWTSSPLLRLWRRLGPGLVTGAADDDPSGIGTHSQIGAQFGFGLSWTFLSVSRSWLLSRRLQPKSAASLAAVLRTILGGTIRPGC